MSLFDMLIILAGLIVVNFFQNETSHKVLSKSMIVLDTVAFVLCGVYLIVLPLLVRQSNRNNQEHHLISFHTQLVENNSK
jgi:hypothetical protein